jgi:ribosomal protein S18 acetylase RimI-like enzyme
MKGSIIVSGIEPCDSEWVRTFLMQHFGSTRVVSRGVIDQADELPGFVALYDNERRALLTYSHASSELEVVTLHAATPGLGLGSRLLLAARARACHLRCRRMWLITTNDNEPAIRFYERRGMRIAAIHRIGPRSCDRGNGLRNHGRGRRDIASIGPRSCDRGNKRRTTAEPSRFSCFNWAAIM